MTAPPHTPAASGRQSTRDRLGDWIESTRIQRLIILVIIANAITLGLETSPTVMGRAGGLIEGLDTAFLTVFVIEIGLKLYARGWRFFTDPWNVFDFVIVGVALVPGTGPLSVLRTLRVLRVLRLVSVVPKLRFIVEALLAAIPGIGAIAALLALIFYVFAVMGTSLFAATFPQWFGTIGDSLYSLFQVMTLESWSMGIARPVMEVHGWAWIFFVTFILLSTFTMVNLFVAVIVDTMQALHEREVVTAEVPPSEAEILIEVRKVRERLDDLTRRL
ncbi:MAG: ion transporter, partial [Actinomycetia bacterium]|nr:ion transporter [Actinomycetes bacterium]